MEKTLHLNLKKKWFDMIQSGEKKEEYRALSDYWCNRFCVMNWHGFDLEIFEHAISHSKVDFDTITFTNGYAKNAPRFVIEFKGITVGKPNPEWSDNWEGQVFILKLGKILSTI